jgi:hypothetical protein
MPLDMPFSGMLKGVVFDPFLDPLFKGICMIYTYICVYIMQGRSKRGSKTMPFSIPSSMRYKGACQKGWFWTPFWTPWSSYARKSRICAGICMYTLHRGCQGMPRTRVSRVRNHAYACIMRNLASRDARVVTGYVQGVHCVHV